MSLKWKNYHHQNYWYEWNEDSIKMDYCATLLNFAAVCKKSMWLWHGTFILATLCDAIWQSHTLKRYVFLKDFQSSSLRAELKQGNCFSVCACNLQICANCANNHALASKMCILYKVTQYLSHRLNWEKDCATLQFPIL